MGAENNVRKVERDRTMSYNQKISFVDVSFSSRMPSWTQRVMSSQSYSYCFNTIVHPNKRKVIRGQYKIVADNDTCISINPKCLSYQATNNCQIEIFKPAIALSLPPPQDCLQVEHSTALRTPIVTDINEQLLFFRKKCACQRSQQLP